jgi:hypothetical protein
VKFFKEKKIEMQYNFGSKARLSSCLYYKPILKEFSIEEIGKFRRSERVERSNVLGLV